MWCASHTQNPGLGLTRAFWAAALSYAWVFCINIMKAESFCQTETSLCYYPLHALFSLFWADYRCQWHTIRLIYCKLNLNSHVSQLFERGGEKKGGVLQGYMSMWKCSKTQHRWKLYRLHLSIPGDHWEQVFPSTPRARLSAPLPGRWEWNL